MFGILRKIYGRRKAAKCLLLFVIMVGMETGLRAWDFSSRDIRPVGPRLMFSLGANLTERDLELGETPSYIFTEQRDTYNGSGVLTNSETGADIRNGNYFRHNYQDLDGNTVSSQRGWPEIQVRFPEYAANFAYGISGGPDFTITGGLYRPNFRIHEDDTTTTSSGGFTSSDTNNINDIFPYNFKPGAVLGAGLKWGFLRGPVHAGVSLKYKAYTRAKYHETTRFSNTLEGGFGYSETAGVTKTELTVDGNEYAASLGISYPIGDIVEPYVAGGYAGGEMNWAMEINDYDEDTDYVSKSNRTVTQKEITTMHQKIKATFKPAKNFFGTVGFLFPLGQADSEDGRWAGLDFSVTFLAETTYHAGGFVRF